LVAVHHLLEEAREWLRCLTSEVLNLIAELAVKTSLEIVDIKILRLWHVCDIFAIVSFSEQSVKFVKVSSASK
jgi:hypothetical protein